MTKEDHRDSRSSPAARSARTSTLAPSGPFPRSIAFGWGAPKLAEQLAGIPLDDFDVMHWQLDADAISRLKVRSVLPDRVGRDAYDRLARTISNGIVAALSKSEGR